MSLFSKIVIGFLILASGAFFYMGLRTLKTHQVWRSRTQVFERELAKYRDQNEVLLNGLDSNTQVTLAEKLEYKPANLEGGKKGHLELTPTKDWKKDAIMVLVSKGLTPDEAGLFLIRHTDIKDDWAGEETEQKENQRKRLIETLKTKLVNNIMIIMATCQTQEKDNLSEQLTTELGEQLETLVPPARGGRERLSKTLGRAETLIRFLREKKREMLVQFLVLDKRFAFSKEKAEAAIGFTDEQTQAVIGGSLSIDEKEEFIKELMAKGFTPADAKPFSDFANEERKNLILNMMAKGFPLEEARTSIDGNLTVEQRERLIRMMEPDFARELAEAFILIIEKQGKLGIRQYRQRLHHALISRHRVWVECTPKSVNPDTNQVELVVEVPIPHGLMKDEAAYAFASYKLVDGGSEVREYLGEFKIVDVQGDDNISLVPTLKMTQREVDLIKKRSKQVTGEAKILWLLYSEMPIDDIMVYKESAKYNTAEKYKEILESGFPFSDIADVKDKLIFEKVLKDLPDLKMQGADAEVEELVEELKTKVPVKMLHESIEEILRDGKALTQDTIDKLVKYASAAPHANLDPSQADGKVVYVEENSRFVFLNIGAAEGVKVGDSFKVVAGDGRDGWAYIEVIKVNLNVKIRVLYVENNEAINAVEGIKSLAVVRDNTHLNSIQFGDLVVKYPWSRLHPGVQIKVEILPGEQFELNRLEMEKTIKAFPALIPPAPEDAGAEGEVPKAPAPAPKRPRSQQVPQNQTDDQIVTYIEGDRVLLDLITAKNLTAPDDPAVKKIAKIVGGRYQWRKRDYVTLFKQIPMLLSSLKDQDAEEAGITVQLKDNYAIVKNEHDILFQLKQILISDQDIFTYELNTVKRYKALLVLQLKAYQAEVIRLHRENLQLSRELTRLQVEALQRIKARENAPQVTVKNP